MQPLECIRGSVEGGIPEVTMAPTCVITRVFLLSLSDWVCTFRGASFLFLLSNLLFFFLPFLSLAGENDVSCASYQLVASQLQIHPSWPAPQTWRWVQINVSFASWCKSNIASRGRWRDTARGKGFSFRFFYTNLHRYNFLTPASCSPCSTCWPAVFPSIRLGWVCSGVPPVRHFFILQLNLGPGRMDFQQIPEGEFWACSASAASQWLLCHSVTHDCAPF